MNERRRIACFFTAGYTELNAMKSFMRKINDTVEYIQLCPTGPRKSRRAIENRHIDQIDKNQNGMTGDKLIEFVNEFIEKKRFEEEGYDAILIEDDKDDRFLALEKDGTATIDKEKWEYFKDDIVVRLGKKRPDIPVIFFMLLRKWKHGFWQIGQMLLAVCIKVCSTHNRIVILM